MKPVSSRLLLEVLMQQAAFPKFKPEQYWSILRLRTLLCCYWLRQLSAATDWAARSVVTGFRACGVVLAIGIFQAGVAPMFWGELLRARLFVAKPYSLFVQCSSQRFSNHELEVLAYAWLSSVAQFWPQ